MKTPHRIISHRTNSSAGQYRARLLTCAQVILGCICVLLGVAAHAATDTWVGNTSANLGDANWTGGNNPPLTGDSWVFGAAGSSGTALNNTLSTGLNVAGISFKTGASAFTFTGNSITLTGDVVNNSTSLETINFGIDSTAARTFTTTTGGGNITLGGLLSGSGGGITKASLGTLTINGTAVNTYTGPTTINGGLLILDYTNATSGVNLINSSSVLVLGGGGLQVKQKPATATSQTFASTTVNSGFSTVVGTSNGVGGLIIALGAITHNVGGAVDFTNEAGPITTTTVNVNGILGGWATVGNAISSTTTGDWAANDGSGNIVKYTGYTVGTAIAGSASTVNYKNTANATVTASTTINSLNEQADVTISSGQTLTLNSGGLFQSGSAAKWLKNAAAATGGAEFLTSGTGELFVHSPNATPTDWRIWPIIQDGLSGPLQLIKDGPGIAGLQNFNTYTGGTVVNGGTLRLYAGGQVGNIRGTVTANLGATVNCTAVNAFGYGVGTRITNAIANGGTLNTSASGDQGWTTTYNLTGGTLTANGGTSSSASASYWVLGGDSLGSGGASGINSFPSTITSVVAGRVNLRNDNSYTNETFDVATGNTPSGIDLLVSAAITGNGVSVTKAGTGTMVLSGANTFNGGVIGSAGTLVLGNNAALGTGLLTMNGGAISNNTGGTLAVVNNINLASTTSFGVNTNDLLILSGVINNTGGLTKVGGGTLALTGPNTYSGTTTVSAGKLVVSAAQSGTGAMAVSDGAKLGMTASGSSHLSPTTLTVGSSTGAALEFTASSTTQAPLTPGTLTLNGANTINVVGGTFVAGNSYPLLSYTTLSGAGTLTAGTIPAGVTGTITFNSGNKTYYLNVTAVASDVWTGTVNGTWDIATTPNWLTNGVAGVYLDGAQVQFDDTGLNTTTVTNLPGTVLSPNGITVTNVTKNYALKTVIGGAGGITKIGTGTLTNSGANTYTGPTVINGGNVVAGVASVANLNGAFGLNSAVSIANTADSALNLNGFATQIGSLTGGGSTGGNVTNGGALLTVGGDNTSPAAYAGTISGTGGLTKIGTGTLTLTGTNAYTGGTAVNAGVVNYSGTLGIAPATAAGALTLNNNGVSAVVNISSPANIAFNNNNALIGNNASGIGAVFQTGGMVSGINQFQLGAVTGGSYGYYRLSGGTNNVTEFDLGGFNGAAVGVCDIVGGVMNISAWFVPSRGTGGTGVLNMLGGTLNFNGPAGQFAGNWNGGTVGTFVINVANSSLLAPLANLNTMQTGGTSKLGEVNLLTGGLLQVNSIAPGSATGFNVLNFNGGTLKANAATATFLTANVTAANVFGGGGTINNNGSAITIPIPLSAPAGNGINSAISVTSGGSGYISAPAVTFSDSTGFDAAGYATISGGAVTGIVITSPGTGYTAPTIVLTGGGGSGATFGAITPTANTSGGMTFNGAGTTTLLGANTYTGTTLVNGGTLGVNPLTTSFAGPVVVTNSALLVDASSGTPQAIASLTLLNSATNIFSYGTVSVNPTAPALNVTSSLSVPGSGLVISLSAFGLQAGQFPLIQYPGALGSIANFALGDLPPGVVANLSNNVANSTIDIVITSTGQNLAWYALLPDGLTVSSNWDIAVTTNWVAVGTTAPALPYKQYTASGTTVGDPVTFDDTVYNDFVNPQITNINLTTPVRPFRFLVDSTLPYSFSSSTSITNGLSGLGGLVKSNTGSLTLLTSNSYTGGTIIGGGTVVITNDFSLGAVSGAVSLADSALQVNGNTTNNTRPFTTSGTSSIGVLTNTTARFGGALTSGGGLSKTDNGTLTLAGNDNFTGTLTVEQGTLNLPGSNNIAGTLTVRRGTLNSTGTNIMPAVVRVADTAGVNGVLNIAGGSFRANNNGGQFASSLTVGSLAGAAGDVQVSASGSLTNAQQLGLGTGAGGYAGFTMSGGSLSCGSYIVVGFNNDTAVYNQSGGAATISSNLMTIAAGGTAAVGVANISGGTFTSVFPANSGIMVGERGNGTLNVSGSAVVTVTNSAGLNVGPTASQNGWSGTANLNGGTVIANKVSKGAGTGTARLNFNGGTLQASAANATFVNGLDRAMIYNNGATIDDGGFAVTIPQPLLAPTGSGIATIAVNPGTSSGYIDTPIVTITDNNGFGSNALATATVSGGAVTAIVITCPGIGFDPINSSIAVAFTGGGASPTPPTIGAVTYVANGSGGLTKKGSGSLTLTGVNTFGGPITNAAGTLSLKTTSTNASAVVNGGTLALTTLSKITGNITISNGASFTLTQVGTATNNSGNLTVGLSAGPGATLGLGLTGLNPTAPLLNVGTLTFNGTNTISVAGAVAIGTIPLVKYVGAIAGAGTFTNITLPQGVAGYITNLAASSTLAAVITSTGPGLVWTGFNTNAAFTNQWNINATTNWLLGATPTVYQQPIIPGDAVTFNDSGSGTVLLNTNVGPSSMIISNVSKSYTFSGIGTIAGSTGVQKLGSGTAFLNLTNSSYTGDTVISNGVLQVGSASAISPSASLAVGSSGTLQLAGFSQTVNGLSGAGLIDTSGSNAVVLTMGNGNGAVNWSGTITNTGTAGASFIKVGTGASVITGTNYLAAVAASQNNGGTMLLTNGGALRLPGGAEFWVMQNAGTAAVIVDNGTIDLANWLVVGRNNASANGTLILNSGLITKTGGGNVVVGSLDATGVLTVNGGQLLNNANLWLGEGTNANATLNLNGGLIQATQIRINGGVPVTSIAKFNGGTLQATADSADFIQTPVVSMVMSNGLVLDDNGFTLSIGTSPLQSGDAFGGGLIKKGAGTVSLDAANTYTGMTTVSNGTLNVNGSIPGAVTVKSGALLGGNGTIGGVVTVQAGGKLGAGASIGLLTLNSSPVLGGTVVAEIDRNGGSPLADQIVVSGNPIAYGGTLVVSNVNLADPPQLGNTFTLFSATSHSGAFSSIVGSPGAGLGYYFTNGILSVVAVSTVATNQPTLTNSVSGSTLTLSWPTDHLGWTLQKQTNSRAIGLKANWFDLTGSESMTTTNITIDKNDPTVFYRLRYLIP